MSNQDACHRGTRPPPLLLRSVCWVMQEASLYPGQMANSHSMAPAAYPSRRCVWCCPASTEQRTHHRGGGCEARTSGSSLRLGPVSVCPPAVSPAPGSGPGLKQMLDDWLLSESLNNRRKKERHSYWVLSCGVCGTEGEGGWREKGIFNRSFVQPTVEIDMCVS